MEGQLEDQGGTYAKEQRQVCVNRGRIVCVRVVVGGHLVGTVEAQVEGMGGHAGRRLWGEEEVLVIAGYSTILCADVSDRAGHYPSLLVTDSGYQRWARQERLWTAIEHRGFLQAES